MKTNRGRYQNASVNVAVEQRGILVGDMGALNHQPILPFLEKCGEGQ